MRPIRRVCLIVDDEALFADAVRDDLASDDLEVLAAGTGEEALRVCRERTVDVVLLDQRLPDTQGPALCPALLESNERMKILFVTAYPNVENAMVAIRSGAFDYISKPCDLEALHVAVRRCLRTLELERAATVKRYRDRVAASEVDLVGGNGGLAEVTRLAGLASGVDSPVLITGETGTGKSLVARAIHLGSARREREFIAVNCAALPESLIEAELFGYERGAFTGAAASHEGLLEMAEGGTLLLDEIGEMPAPLQSRLLNVLEDRVVRRVGGRMFRAVDFRLVAATNGDVEEAVRAHRIREDLYYRLNVLRLHLPPLRDRRHDIPALVAHFLDRIAGEDHGLGVSGEEVARLAAYDWPGNLRELRNVLERAVLLRRGPDLKPSDVLLTRCGSCPDPSPPAGGETMTLDELERRHVAEALARHEGNLTRTAKSLGISVSTLRRKLPRRER